MATDFDKKDYLRDRWTAIIDCFSVNFLQEISVIRECYRLTMDIVDFFQNQYPRANEKINGFYIQLMQFVEENLGTIEVKILELAENKRLDGDFDDYLVLNNFFFKPFSNLFSAKQEVMQSAEVTSGEINWVELKEKMNLFFGNVEIIFHDCGEPQVRGTAAILKNQTERYLSTKDKGAELCRFENNTLFITLIDGTEKSLPLTTRRKTKCMLVMFKILYLHWQNFVDSPLEKFEIKWRFKREIPNRDVSDGFIGNTIANIRTKIKSHGLTGIVTISYDREMDGYSLKIEPPSVSTPEIRRV